MKSFLLAALLFLVAKCIVAQHTPLPAYEKLAVRISPLGLIDPFDENLTVGAAYTINSRLTVCADLSFIFYSVYFQDNKITYGYIFKPAIRYYLSERRRFFLESAIFYKRVGYKIHDWLDKDIVSGVPSYQSLEHFTYLKQVLGLNMQCGVQFPLKKDQRLRMEIYAGLGFRHRTFDVKNQPGSSYNPNNFFDGSFEETADVLPSLPHGLRIVYVIR